MYVYRAFLWIPPVSFPYSEIKATELGKIIFQDMHEAKLREPKGTHCNRSIAVHMRSKQETSEKLVCCYYPEP